MTPHKYLFGPVPSRRLGRSLGVDLVPSKTCSLNCLFCQLGHSPATVLERREYVPTADVLAELGDWFTQGIEADYVTLSGSGEPTLHSRFGDILRFVRANGTHRTALLTNGTLLDLPAVRADACNAHVVKVSLSAWDQASFELLNHPHANLRLDRLLAGYRALRTEYAGEIWLEVFLVPGLNTSPRDVARIAALARAFSPDRIHLNTAVRPTADPSIVPLPRLRMEALAGIFTPAAEVIAEFSGSAPAGQAADGTMVLAVLQRHQATPGQLSESLGIAPVDVEAILRTLTEAGEIETLRHGGELYYQSRKNAPAR